MSDAVANRRGDRAVIGAVDLDRDARKLDHVARFDLGDHNNWPFVEVLVMGEAIALVRGEHGHHSVHHALGARWPDHHQRCRAGRHHPVRRHDVAEVTDVVAVEMGEQHRAEADRKDAGGGESQHDPASAVEQQGGPTAAQQGRWARPVRTRQRTARAQQGDLHRADSRAGVADRGLGGVLVIGPPLQEARRCCIVAEWAFVEAKFHEEPERTPDDGPGADREQFHDLVAGQVRPQAVELFLLAELFDPRLSSSIRRASARALLAFRVVQSHRVSSFSRSRRGPASRT